VRKGAELEKGVRCVKRVQCEKSETRDKKVKPNVVIELDVKADV